MLPKSVFRSCGCWPEGSGRISWPPGGSVDSTSDSMAGGQVSQSHSHVFMSGGSFNVSFLCFHSPVPVVTGASQGIGRGYALEVCRES